MTLRRKNTNQNALCPAKHPNFIWKNRQKMGYSQEAVAYLLGHNTTAHICAYERGQKLPNLENALKLEIILSLPVAFLYRSNWHELRELIQERKTKLASTL